MRCQRVLTILFFSFVGSLMLYAQSDRSCRAVELHVIEMKLDAVRSVLPPLQAQQFQDKKKQFEIDMKNQFDQSKENDQKIVSLAYEELGALVKSDPEFARKVLDRVRKNHPGLQGQDLEQAFAYTATHDPEFHAQLQPHLMHNPNYDAIATQMLRDDAQGTRTENLQLQLADKIPPTEYDKEVRNSVTHYIATSKKQLGALSDNKPFQDLLATVAYGQRAINATYKEAGTAEASARWDTYAPDVAQSLKLSHGVQRGMDGETREAQLIIDHLDKVMPSASGRKQFMEDSQKELPKAAASITAASVQTLLKKSESTRLFRNIEVPVSRPRIFLDTEL